MTFDTSKLFLATVSYADIFEWPLTEAEAERWFIGGEKGRRHILPRDIVREEVSGESYYHIRNRRGFVLQRRMHERWAQKKWEIAKRSAYFLTFIPSILLVGVTGGLSRNNVKKNDDIDFFCITSSRTLWISRLLAIITMEFFGTRRRPGEIKVADKVCLNMFMSEDSLQVEKTDRDLFSAYEVLQMTPLWEREGAYKKFLMANKWVKKFLPQAWEWRVSSKQLVVNRQNKIFLFSIFCFLFSLFEPFARTTQLWYMKSRRTSEVIEPGVLRFHPRDAREWIKRALEKRLFRYNIPLDKIFYAR